MAEPQRSRRLEQALEAARRGDLRRAADIYGQLVEERPDDPALLQRLGDARARSGDRQGARTAFVRLAGLYEKAADHRRSVAALRRACQLGEPDPALLERLGARLRDAGRDADAREPWIEALEAARRAGQAERALRLALSLSRLEPARAEWLSIAAEAAGALEPAAPQTAASWLEIVRRSARSEETRELLRTGLERALRADPSGGALEPPLTALTRELARSPAAGTALGACGRLAGQGNPAAALTAGRLALGAGDPASAADLADLAADRIDLLAAPLHGPLIELLGGIVSADPSRGDVLERLERLTGDAAGTEEGGSADDDAAGAPAEPSPPQPHRSGDAPAVEPRPQPREAPPESVSRAPSVTTEPEDEDWIVLLTEEGQDDPSAQEVPEKERAEPAPGQDPDPPPVHSEREHLDRLGGEVRRAVDPSDAETSYQMAVGLLEMGLEDQALELAEALLDDPQRAVDAALMVVPLRADAGQPASAIAAGERALSAGVGDAEASRKLRDELSRLREAVGPGHAGGPEVSDP